MLRAARAALFIPRTAAPPAAMPKGKERERERLSTSNFYSECEDRKRDKFLKVTEQNGSDRETYCIQPNQGFILCEQKEPI